MTAGDYTWIKAQDLSGRLVVFRLDQIVGYRGGDGMPGKECTEVTTVHDPRRVVVGCTVEEFDALLAAAVPPEVDAVATAKAQAGFPAKLPSAAGHPDTSPDMLPGLPPIPTEAWEGLRGRLLDVAPLGLTHEGAANVTAHIRDYVRSHNGKRISTASLRRELGLTGLGWIQRDQAEEVIVSWLTTGAGRSSG